MIAVVSVTIVCMGLAVFYLVYLAGNPQGKGEVVSLNIAISTDIKTLDIATATAVADFEVLGNVYEALFKITYDESLNKLVYIPWLVKSYSVVNETLWIFRLRDGVVFHNGKKLTALDVNASIMRALRVGGIPKMLFTDAKGEPIIERIVVFNETVFGIRLQKPFSPLIEHLAHLSMAIMPKEIAEKYMDNMITDINDVIGTGPYRITEWERGTYIRLTGFGNYWRGAPKVRELKYLVTPDPNARVVALRTGQADIAVGVPPEVVNELKSKGYNIIVTPIVRHVIMAINTQRIPDVRIRQAMNYAVDKEALVRYVMRGYAKVSTSVISTFFPEAVELKPYEYNPDKARELLTEAGGINRTLTLLVSTRGAKDLELAEAIKSYLADIGITVSIVTMEHSAFLKRVFTEHDFDLAIYGPSPSSAYYGLTYWRTNASLNGPLYSNPEVDRLLDLAAQVEDKSIRLDIYRQIQEIIWSECPAVWLYYEVLITATKPGIDGVVVLPFQRLQLDAVVGLGMDA